MDILPMNFSRFIRQVASLTCAGTVAWDYIRSPEILGFFSTWTLLLHFTYFQLPLQSRAIPFFHSISFVGANVIPVLYGYLILWKPRLELDHMNEWNIEWNTIIVRALLVNIAPLLFHAIDIAANQSKLVISYNAMTTNLMFMWTCMSFGVFGILHDFTYSGSDEVSEGLEGISNLQFRRRNKFLFLIANMFAVLLLYFLIYRRRHIKRRNSNRSLGPTS